MKVTTGTVSLIALVAVSNARPYPNPPEEEAVEITSTKVVESTDCSDWMRPCIGLGLPPRVGFNNLPMPKPSEVANAPPLCDDEDESCFDSSIHSKAGANFKSGSKAGDQYNHDDDDFWGPLNFDDAGANIASSLVQDPEVEDMPETEQEIKAFLMSVEQARKSNNEILIEKYRQVQVPENWQQFVSDSIEAMCVNDFDRACVDYCSSNPEICKTWVQVPNAKPTITSTTNAEMLISRRSEDELSEERLSDSPADGFSKSEKVDITLDGTPKDIQTFSKRNTLSGTYHHLMAVKYHCEQFPDDMRICEEWEEFKEHCGEHSDVDSLCHEVLDPPTDYLRQCVIL